VRFAIIDIETTGGNYKQGKIIEIAIFIYEEGRVIDSFCSLINPGIKLDPFITRLTGIKDKMLTDEPSFAEIAKRILEITTNCVFVAHNVQFDYGFVREEFRRIGHKYKRKKLCTHQLAKKAFPHLPSHSLGKLCKSLNIPLEQHHRAAADAQATTYLFDMIAQSENNNLIQAAVNLRTSSHWPTNLSVDLVASLPEETGIYYFHDNEGNVIYLGKTSDIQNRVFQHFSQIPQSEWRQQMFNTVTSVSYELTGSDLIASIQESYELLNELPTFNKRQKSMRYPWGIVQFTDHAGYICFRVARLRHADARISCYRNEKRANEALKNLMSQYGLHPSKCGMPELHGISKMEKLTTYNAKAEAASKQFDFNHPNFLIVGEGKHNDEHSVVLIKNGMFGGYDYFEQEMLNYPNEVANLIKAMPINREIEMIIRSHLKSPHSDKIILLSNNN